MKKEGFFITLEGGEGAGKSTLIKGLQRYLLSKNKEILTTFEPGGTEFGKQIRSILLDKNNVMPPEAEFFLYLSDRAYHVENVILPALKSGKIVICDRFTDSSVAYQGAGRGFISPKEIERMSLIATKQLSPDLTFYLQIKPIKALSRIKGEKDRLESESLFFHEKVQQGYETIARENPQRVIVLDGENSVEEVLKEAIFHLNKTLESKCLPI
jgi:dTMP kinase